jgi:hypothetical protein
MILRCLMPTQNLVFYNLFILCTGVHVVCCHHKNLVSVTCLFYVQEYMFSVAIKKILLSMKYFSMDRSTWCPLLTQNLVFYDLFNLWTRVHSVCCYHKNLVFNDFFILWTIVHGFCCQHKHVFYELFILWTGVHGVCCQHEHLVFYELFILWTGVHGVCCQQKNLVFYYLYFYEQEYMVSAANTKILFSMTYLLFIPWVGVHGFCCQHKPLVFYDLYILWTGVHGVCCQHENRGCGQTTAARVQHAKYYVSI